MASARTTEGLGLPAVTVGVFFFSTGPVIVAGAETPGLTAAFWRVLLGGAFFGVLAGVRREFVRAMFTKTVLAGIGFGTANALFFEAVQITSVANAVLIAVMQPVPLLIAGRIFFGERVRRFELAWVVVALAGAAVMILSGSSAGSGDLRGDLLAAGSMLLTAVYFIGAKQARETVPTVPFMAGLWFWATASLAPLLVLTDAPLTPDQGGEWLRIVGVAALPGFGHFLINFAHRTTSLAVVAVLQLFNPASAAVLALVFLDQGVTGWQWAGMAVVIISLTIYTVVHGRRPDEPIVAPDPTTPSTATI